MKKLQKVFWLFTLIVFVCGLFSACGKQDEKEKKDDSAPVSVTEATTPSATPVVGLPPVKAYKHGTMPMEMNLPETATVSETASDITAETADYLLYTCEVNTCEGILLYGASDVITIMNTPEKKDAVKDMLHLQSYTVPENADAKLYDSINGAAGIWCLLSNMEFVKDAGTVSKGDGFMMVYDKKEGLGAYVVFGIYKGASLDTETKELLQSCALSLQQSDDVKGKYVLWTETFPDGTAVKASLGKDINPEGEKAERGVYLYYDDDKFGQYVIEHYFKVGNSTAKEYLEGVIKALSADDTTVSTPEEIKGKLTFWKATMTYPREGKEVQEVLCVSIDEKNNVWFVDLFGTTQQVKEQEKNLLILLGTIQED